MTAEMTAEATLRTQMEAGERKDNIHAIPTASVAEDIRRAREFYSYLQPDNLLSPQLRRRNSTFDSNNQHVPSLSASLAPYCQLTALRCDVRKAMLNVMDRDVMYFLAESSRVKHDDTVEFIEDPILLSCSTVPLKGRICELTLRLDTKDSAAKPIFIIPDLTKSQFAEMTIVTGPPYYRFYAGAPITTRDGINIGSLAVMDDKTRPNGLSQAEEDFLNSTAQQIMLYLETNRQAIEGRRSRRMAEGLEAFIAGKRSLWDEGDTDRLVRSQKKKPRHAYGFQFASDEGESTSSEASRDLKRHTRLNRRSGSVVSVTSIDSSISAVSTDADELHIKNQEPTVDSRTHANTFARAANLLRECMGSLGEDGSVRFISIKARVGGKASRSSASAELTAMVNENGTGIDSKEFLPTAKYRTQSTRATVTACSTEANPLENNTNPITGSADLDEVALRDLMKRYPGGHLWSLEGNSYSSDEESSANTTRTTSVNKSAKNSRRRRTEITAIRSAFPGARQVLFAPLWDSTIGSFAHGVFVATALETRSFSAVQELSFLNSFCSTVMAECSRLDTMMADKQKSDFVGTISHEMRSPLHGVLASVEFLADTEMNGFQRSLINTIDSCGRTLLDTINHVLDFSKVNSFQKQWEGSNKKSGFQSKRNHFLGPENATKPIYSGAPALLQLFGVTEISAVLEEVVDGLVLGQTYSSGVDFTDLSREARGRGRDQEGSVNSEISPEAVEILLDIERADWAFLTQPGAVRRIIMNITGNAMKYTFQGTICVRLRLTEVQGDGESKEMMVLTVTDTGKGISPEFLSSRLFVPFAQENALAPGTGLGLSIVRSIVLMLGGTIDVQSTIDVGTTVEVALPMQRRLPGQVSSQNTPHSAGTTGSGSSIVDDSILLLQNQAAGVTVVYYKTDLETDGQCAKIMQQYVQDWYHLELADSRLVASASVVIVGEEDLEDLMEKAMGTPGHRPAMVVMCSVSSRHSSSKVKSLEQRIGSAVEFLARPYGPYKLARCIRLVLEKKRELNSRFPLVKNLGAIAEAITPIPPETTRPEKHVDDLQDMDLNTPGSNDASMFVQANETFAASQTSQHAQMAIHKPAASSHSVHSQQDKPQDGFPFPAPDEVTPTTDGDKNPLLLTGQSFATSPPSAVHSPPTQVPALVEIDPKFLLVDDNKINLKLLETFIRNKRKYTRITKAENGLQAVNAVTCAKENFDIIFMDISMPIMNGFEAMRAIREFEERTQIKSGAMIIALTGLASGEDQSEGFDSGCDLYMTKPVSFKEVGKLLDNWKENQALNRAAEKMTDLDLGLKSGLHRT